MAKRSPKRVCFDLETEAFSQEFGRAPDLKTRLKHAPKMRLACAFDGSNWHVFCPRRHRSYCAYSSLPMKSSRLTDWGLTRSY